MKFLESNLAGLITALILMCPFPTALSMTSLHNGVTGVLTAPSNGESLTLDGHVYRIKPGSPAAEEARKLQTGTVVDALLDGPANTSKSEVLHIRLHPAK